MYSRRMISCFAYRMNYGPEPDTISYLMKNGARITEAPIQINDRLSGESYLRPLTAARYMARMLVSILLVQGARHEAGIAQPEKEAGPADVNDVTKRDV